MNIITTLTACMIVISVYFAGSLLSDMARPTEYKVIIKKNNRNNHYQDIKGQLSKYRVADIAGRDKTKLEIRRS